MAEIILPNQPPNMILCSTVPLKTCAEIIAGIHFREVEKTDLTSPYREIQIKHIAPDQPISLAQLNQINLRNRPSEQIIKSGDVLFIARGIRKIALPFFDPPENLVVGSAIFILRVHLELIDPAYLAWYINQSPAQNYIARRSKGSNIKVISKRELSRLPIHLPSLAQQQLLVQVHHLRLAEQRLVREIEVQQNLLLDTLLLRSLQDSFESPSI